MNKKILLLIIFGTLLVMSTVDVSAVGCTRSCWQCRAYASTQSNCGNDVGGWRDYYNSNPGGSYCRNNAHDSHASHRYKTNCNYGRYSGCGSYSCNNYWGGSLSCSGTAAYRDYYTGYCSGNGCGHSGSWVRFPSWDSSCCTPTCIANCGQSDGCGGTCSSSDQNKWYASNCDKTDHCYDTYGIGISNRNTGNYNSCVLTWSGSGVCGTESSCDGVDNDCDGTEDDGVCICGNEVVESYTGENCDLGASNTDEPCDPPYLGSCTYCNTACKSTTLQGGVCGDNNLDIEDGEECDGTADAGCSGNCVSPGDSKECLCNDYPSAVIDVDSLTKKLGEQFAFDGSGSFDPDGDAIEYRWDFDNDGAYDTSYASSSTTNYAYSTAGVKTAKLQVKDSYGLTGTETKVVYVGNVVCGRFEIDCEVDIGGINSIKAYIDNGGSEVECDYLSWNGNKARFECDGTSLSVDSLYDVYCTIDSGKSYQSGADTSEEVLIVDCNQEICDFNYVDEDSDGETDYDSQDGIHGDDECKVGIVDVAVSTITPYEMENMVVTCESSVADINSISAYISDGTAYDPCEHQSWSGTDATFECWIGSPGTKFVNCTINQSRSYQRYNDRTKTVEVLDTPEICNNGVDDDLDGEIDWDSQDWTGGSNDGIHHADRHGDIECSVSILDITLSNSTPYEGVDVELSCTSSAADVNSIDAYIVEDSNYRPCTYKSWNNNVVKFTCDAGLPGTKTALCMVDTEKSHQGGSNASLVMNVQERPLKINISLSADINNPTTDIYTLNRQIPVDITLQNLYSESLEDFYIADSTLPDVMCGVDPELGYARQASNTACNKISQTLVECSITLDDLFSAFETPLGFYGCVKVGGLWDNSSIGYLKIDSTCGDTKLFGIEECEDNLDARCGETTIDCINETHLRTTVPSCNNSCGCDFVEFIDKCAARCDVDLGGCVDIFYETCEHDGNCTSEECCYRPNQNVNGTCRDQLPADATNEDVESNSCLCRLSRLPDVPLGNICDTTGEAPCWDTNPANPAACCGNQIDETWDETYSSHEFLEDILIEGYCLDGAWKSREDAPALTFYNMWVSE